MQEKISTLSVSCVFYDTKPEIFKATLDSLMIAVLHAKSQKELQACELHVINNNPNNECIFFEAINPHKEKFDNLIIHNGHGNIGYGRGNNLAINTLSSNYHLILNPDVIQTEDALAIGIKYLQNHPDVGLVAPSATNQHGEIEYLAKRQPSFFVLLLRVLNKSILNKWFKNKLDLYTYKDKISNQTEFDIELASGCYMLVRSEILKQAGGFSNKYFLYFEDFDLSRQIRCLAKVKFLASIKIVHHGGNSSSKGLKHMLLFCKSYLRFINLY